jgi:CRISP-associated protein Cas1
MLSLACAMLTRHLTIALASVGLDPYRGFYHAPRYGGPALALDLMEPFRAIIADSVVLSAVNKGEVGPSDFVVAVTGTALTQAGRRRFVEAFERRLSQETTHRARSASERNRCHDVESGRPECSSTSRQYPHEEQASMDCLGWIA